MELETTFGATADLLELAEGLIILATAVETGFAGLLGRAGKLFLDFFLSSFNETHLLVIRPVDGAFVEINSGNSSTGAVDAAVSYWQAVVLV